MVPSVYIGGGTPSVLGAARMERLLAGVNGLLAGLGGRPREFTVEANPESADGDFLRACTAGGVNRISIGIQTFNGESRRAIGRGGVGRGGFAVDGILRRIALVAEHFPGAFSVDLIAGLPFQTGAVLSGDIECLLGFGPAHVSLYSLILEPETALGRRFLDAGITGSCSLPTEDEADGLWIAGRDMLEEAGFEQYEVSNFALPGKACAHNIRYWRMENWLGVGPSASGTMLGESGAGQVPLTGRRFTYPRDIAGYLAAPRPLIQTQAHAEELSAADLMRESLLMGFRYREGPDGHRFKSRFGREIADCIPGTIARWSSRGFFETGGSPGTLAPSRKGLLFVNGFLRDAFAEMGDG